MEEREFASEPVPFQGVRLTIDYGKRADGAEGVDGYFLVGGGGRDSVYVWFKLMRPTRHRGPHTESIELRLPNAAARDLAAKINAVLADKFPQRGSDSSSDGEA